MGAAIRNVDRLLRIPQNYNCNIPFIAPRYGAVVVTFRLALFVGSPTEIETCNMDKFAIMAN